MAAKKPSISVRLPKAAEGFLDDLASVVAETKDVIRRADRVVRKAKRAKRAGRTAASVLGKARPRLSLDLSTGRFGINLGDDDADDHDTGEK